MQIAISADEYAAPRLNIFFTANNQTPDDGNLTGQCVTLVKWFMAEMSEVPNPFSARGHARYLGAKLVSQGLADLIPAGQQIRGDVVCYEYGTYGHTGIMLSGNRLFQQNVNTAGAQRKVLEDGTVVYSSTVVPLYKLLGGVAPKFYRLKTYKEGSMDSKVDRGGLEIIWRGFLDRAPMDSEYKEYVGRGWATVLFTVYSSDEYKNRYAGLVKNWDIVTNQVPKLNQRIKELEAGGLANPKAMALYNAVINAVK